MKIVNKLIVRLTLSFLVLCSMLNGMNRRHNRRGNTLQTLSPRSQRFNNSRFDRNIIPVGRQQVRGNVNQSFRVRNLRPQGILNQQNLRLELSPAGFGHISNENDIVEYDFLRNLIFDASSRIFDLGKRIKVSDSDRDKKAKDACNEFISNLDKINNEESLKFIVDKQDFSDFRKPSKRTFLLEIERNIDGSVVHEKKPNPERIPVDQALRMIKCLLVKNASLDVKCKYECNALYWAIYNVYQEDRLDRRNFSKKNIFEDMVLPLFKTIIDNSSEGNNFIKALLLDKNIRPKTKNKSISSERIEETALKLLFSEYNNKKNSNKKNVYKNFIRLLISKLVEMESNKYYEFIDISKENIISNKIGKSRFDAIMDFLCDGIAEGCEYCNLIIKKMSDNFRLFMFDALLEKSRNDKSKYKESLKKIICEIKDKNVIVEFCNLYMDHLTSLRFYQNYEKSLIDFDFVFAKIDYNDKKLAYKYLGDFIDKVKPSLKRLYANAKKFLKEKIEKLIKLEEALKIKRSEAKKRKREELNEFGHNFQSLEQPQHPPCKKRKIDNKYNSSDDEDSSSDDEDSSSDDENELCEEVRYDKDGFRCLPDWM